MYNRFIDADYTSSAFSIGFALLAVSYLKSNAPLIIGLMFIAIGLLSVNAYSFKNIARTLKLIYYVIMPVEMVMAAYAFSRIELSNFIAVSLFIALANLIVIIVLKRRLSILSKHGKYQPG